jgi:hypothetical protein
MARRRRLANEPSRSRSTTDQRHAIISSQTDVRDTIALRLLLDYALRNGALCAIQFKHFDHQRQRLTIFTKGERIRELPIPDPAFWKDLEHPFLDIGARPDDYLLCRHRMIPVGKPDATGKRRTEQRHLPDKPMSQNGAHLWCTPAYTTPGSSRRARTVARRCTRRGTRQVSACSTPPAI